MGRRAGRTSFFDDTRMYRRKIPAAEWTWSASRGRRVGRVCFLWATFLCTSKERCARAPKAGESSALALALALALAATAEARAFSPLRGASYFSLLVQRKITKRNTPCLRAHAATRRGSTPPAGFFDTTSLSWRKTTCIHARRPSGSSHWLRRCGRGPVNQRQEQEQRLEQPQLQKLPLPSPPLRFAQGRERSSEAVLRQVCA